MPLFEIHKDTLNAVGMTNFGLEKDLQKLVEGNLGAVFNCRFVASEFSTGQTHAGRIDTLAISEENNPVIIEYKKVESSELITQSLFYLNWIYDHKGDFAIAVQKSLGEVEVDWSDVRVICIAPNFRKYDLHAVQVMGANIELWSYRLYDNGMLYFEQVYGREHVVSGAAAAEEAHGKNPVMVLAGKKAAMTRATGSYTFEEHLEGRPEAIRAMAIQIQEYVMGLDPAIIENPKKHYIGYKTSQNIVCMSLLNHKIILTLKLNPGEFSKLPQNAKDLRNKGHWGTGDFELTIKNEADLESAKPLIEMAYKKIGG